MEKKVGIVLPIGIFLLIFLSIFLLREISFTGRSTGTIIIRNSAPLLLTDPAINDSSPDTNNVITCISGQYFDSDNHPKYADYYRWYRNNLRIQSEFINILFLSTTGYGDAGDVIRCSQTSSDGFSNATWKNSTAVTISGIPPTTINPITLPGGSGGSGGSGSATTVQGCVQNFYCSPWTDCIEGVQTRECLDLNRCFSQFSNIETRLCLQSTEESTIETTIAEQQPEDVVGSYTIISVILISLVTLLVLFLLIISIILSRRHAKKAISGKTANRSSDLLRYIRQALDRGYSKEQIEEALLRAGWPKEMIRESFKEIT